jgi:hypothetical protein
MDSFLIQYNFERMLTEYTTNGWGNALYLKKNIAYKYNR